ncbi:alpha/beta fold hydrolase [Limisphaera ngatamarikiensis]|uniref:Alpha/beta fold hydrolase n=1 Tax=Limisphaera ngatamarikiensis TaxID=1324935 RepID=A0A6M1RN54_9BACT|nr:alpha/beta hydrolase [Limisphaera ngatamarikiensis]NGO39123.1 alpha/beta fold hydrolase [Limisphaera ngatamarikiensis]
MTRLNCHIIPAAEPDSKRLLLMMHGLGDSHEGYLWLPDALQLPWLHFALPDAPDAYYGGYSWFDIFGNPVPGVRRSYQLLHDLLQELHHRGWPPDQMIVGGFSQGGLMAIEVALRYPHRIAGALCISGAVCEPETLIREASPAARQQRILATHGRYDDILPIHITRRQIQQLQQAGFPITWIELEKAHTIAGQTELQLIRDFILSCYESEAPAPQPQQS